MTKNDRIVITGVGPLTAIGSGSNNVWQSILDKKTGLVQKEYFIGGQSVGKYYIHEIKKFNVDGYDFNRQVLNEIKSWKNGDEIIDLYYFLAVIKMAIDDSKLKIDDNNKESVGLILAHENMGLDHFYEKIISDMSFTDKSDGEKPVTKKDFLEYFYKKFQRTGYELQTFMSLHHIAKMFDIHGFSLFLNNACASGLYALEAAADAIRSGKCAQMVVAAVDHSSVFKNIWFSNINMLAKDGRIKPFASDRDGFTIGDGGAAVVLESMESALKRKANIYAEYLSGAFILEGWKVTYPDVANDLYAKMINKAILNAGIEPQDVDLIIPHGVGTNITDRYEAGAIVKVFGNTGIKPIVSAFKPYVGHVLGGTALLETAIMLIGLKNGEIPQTLNCEHVDTSLGIDILKETIKAGEVKIAMKTACGFAGFNGACIFKKT